MQDYRPDITKKLKRIILTKESFRIESKTGLGKSKYLRNIVKNPKFNNSFLKPNKIKMFYIDCNRFYKKSTKQFIKIFGNALLGKNNPKLTNIEDFLRKTDYTIYFFFDEASLLANMEEGVLNILTALMGSFKNIFNIVLISQNFNFLEKPQFLYIKKQTVLTLKFTPQNKKQINNTINDFCIKFNIRLNKKQVEYLAKKSKGSPLVVKQTLLKVLEGLSLQKALNQRKTKIEPKKYLEFEKNQKTTKQNLREYQKFLTRNEYLFLEKLISNIGLIVTRDELAYVLSPQSQGEGVSNEAIDQIISRLRKDLKKINKNIIIKNKRGVGYYIEE